MTMNECTLLIPFVHLQLVACAPDLTTQNDNMSMFDMFCPKVSFPPTFQTFLWRSYSRSLPISLETSKKGQARKVPRQQNSTLRH
jgi:hypothetical protein